VAVKSTKVGGLDDPAEDLEQRQSARAVTTDQADDFTAIELERYVPQRQECRILTVDL
jgi:hypothetical protein